MSALPGQLQSELRPTWREPPSFCTLAHRRHPDLASMLTKRHERLQRLRQPVAPQSALRAGNGSVPLDASRRIVGF